MLETGLRMSWVKPRLRLLCCGDCSPAMGKNWGVAGCGSSILPITSQEGETPGPRRPHRQISEGLIFLKELTSLCGTNSMSGGTQLQRTASGEPAGTPEVPQMDNGRERWSVIPSLTQQSQHCWETEDGGSQGEGLKDTDQRAKKP